MQLIFFSFYCSLASTAFYGLGGPYGMSGYGHVYVIILDPVQNFPTELRLEVTVSEVGYIFEGMLVYPGGGDISIGYFYIIS